jgi:hypothetical protein
MPYLTFNPILVHLPDTHSMKRSTGKPSKGTMRFFTPDLYLRVNSADDVVADRADLDWESALEKYREHLAEIQDRLPERSKDLSKACLHDAEVIAFEADVKLHLSAEKGIAKESDVAILSVRQTDQIWTIIYVLAGPVQKATTPKWPFSKKAKHWLYEEVDVAVGNGGESIQRIMFSDGDVIEIRFNDVLIRAVSAVGTRSRQIA